MKRKALYDQTGGAFRTVIREMDERFMRIMIFGHNPSITDFARALAPDFTDEIPASGTVCIELEAPTWKAVSEGKGRVVGTEYPGRAPKDEPLKRLKRELEAEIEEAVNRTYAARNEAAARDLRETVRQAAKKLAGKFAKKLKDFEKDKSRDRN
jgi:phosphohistidine phosphatase